jgi:SAM-dependent methyltransferase
LDRRTTPLDLVNLQQHWNEFGTTDPFWAILSDPSKRNGGWDPEEFFDTGRQWVAKVVEDLDARGFLAQARRRRALDFGCGAGRLTQALSRHFERCDGVDIAPSMIDLANRYNRYGGRCHYHLNAAPDLGLFPDGSFDFVYSQIVLQHMEPQYAHRYIGEFLRVLAPGGVAMFQLPGEVIPAAARKAALDAGAKQSPARGPLPASAFKARVTALDPPPDRLAGSQYQLRVRVKNLGDVPWPAAGDVDGRFRVKVASRWFDAASDAVVGRENSSTLLPADVPPGAEAEVPLLINVPNRAGRYVVEVDLLQEAVGWFRGRGSAPATVWVGVFDMPGGGDDAAPAAPVPAPEIQMYGTPRLRVIEVVKSHGGKVLDVAEDHMAGEHWESFTYSVTK